MDKTEIKIFFTFFLVFSYFIQWTSWNEDSRFALVRAIVDEKRFEIDNWYNQTGDRAYYNEHYYSDKNPGLSFIAAPIYSGWKFVYSLFSPNINESHPESNGYITLYIRGLGGKFNPIIYYPDVGALIYISKILVTVLTSSLISALMVLLIYKLSSYFLRDERKRLLLTFTMGLGTIILPTAVIFWDQAIATFLGFLSFYILFRVQNQQIENNKHILLAGLFLGYAITCNFILIIIGIYCLLYLFKYRKIKISYFILGIFLGLLPFILYSYSILNNIYIDIGYPYPPLLSAYSDESIWPEEVTVSQYAHGVNALKLLFSPERGLFFYYPVLLLMIPGIILIYKKFRIETLLLIFIIFILLWVVSGEWSGLGGICFGPRHLMPFIPFLVLPLSYAFEKFSLKIIVPLLVWSIFVNILSFQTYDLVYQGTDINFSEYFLNVYQTFFMVYNGELAKLNPSEFRNPLLEYYLPLFIRNGPRSKIFEGVLLHHTLDIRYVPHATISNLTQSLVQDRYLEPSAIPLFFIPKLGTFFLKIPFLCLTPLIAIMPLIWKRETAKIIRRFNRKIFFIIFAIVIVLFILLFIRIENKV
jgi:hypothetical protein